MRERRRLWIQPERLSALSDGLLSLTAEESRYLSRVLRFAPGDGFALIDGAGGMWHARLERHDAARLEQPWPDPLRREAAPHPPLVLAAAVVKRDFDVLVRMAVELGVDRLVPLLCERTAVHGGLKPERWRTIAAEAAEQCERLWLPQIDEPTAVSSWLGQGPAGPCFWATTRQPQLPSLEERLEQLPAGADSSAPLTLALGPEGGWSAAEDAEALRCGWQGVQLGPRILRSSTAAVHGIGLLSSWRTRRYGR